MLCLKAEEALEHERYSTHGVIHPVNLRRSIRKVIHRVGRGRSAPSSRSSADGSASCSGVDDEKSCGSARQGRLKKMSSYRVQLEEEVQGLQHQLQEEINLHVALTKALAYNSTPLLSIPCRLPEQAQELLGNISTLEVRVSKLEKELASLQIQLCQERDECWLAENHLNHLLSLSAEHSPSSSSMWEEHISSLRLAKFRLNQMPSSSEPDLSSGRDSGSELATPNQLCVEINQEELLGPQSKAGEGNKLVSCIQQFDESELKKDFTKIIQSNNPNWLSEEMVKCMRNIFICLAESSDISLKSSSSDCLLSQSSSVDRLSSSSFSSFSDSSLLPSTSKNPSIGRHQKGEGVDQMDIFDPYGVNGKVNGWNVGIYSLAAEVSWVAVGKKQLEYAAKALKGYRFLVKQLARANPALMSGNERLAFWINVYNALMMHAYLAYGVPRSEIKLFSLMQKASYLVGGQSFSAAEIEFIMLKMKPPLHRPQLALVLAIYKFKISEKHSKYSVDSPEPLVLFALSCGMFSSPAVRVFTADNVKNELHNSMRDYVRASVGISEKGKLLVPKMLHSFAKGIVEDSLLVDWICRHLSPNQVTIVRDSISLRKQRLLGVRSFSVIQFDPRFRFLFLPDDKICPKSSH